MAERGMENQDEDFCSELEWTGERFLPGAADLCFDTCYEHLHRYAFALQLVKGKNVLDIPCGEGYGADMLASQAGSVTAVDIDEKSIGHARKRYRRHNLKFLTGDMTSVPVKGEKIFDVVVCFEGIEHIKEQHQLLKEIKRLLKDDGVLLVSTPNKSYTEHRKLNPFHYKELYFAEFEELLKDYFKSINFYCQRIIVGSNIWPLSDNSDQTSEFVIGRGPEEFLFYGKDKKSAVLYIAVASDSPMIQSGGNSFLIDGSDSLIKLYETQVALNEEQIEELKKQITELKTSPIKKLERAFRKKIVYPVMDIFKGKEMRRS